jgi:hypothetical protein
MPEQETPAARLRAAAARVRDGWTQGEFVSSDGSVSALGGILDLCAVDRSPEWSTVAMQLLRGDRMAVAATLALHLYLFPADDTRPFSPASIAWDVETWNDTQPDASAVVEAMEKAASAVEGATHAAA